MRQLGDGAAPTNHGSPRVLFTLRLIPRHVQADKPAEVSAKAG